MGVQGTLAEVGSLKQLLFDDALMESREGFTTTMNPAIRTEGPVLIPEKTWEHNAIWWIISVVDDEGVYKMWYDAWDEENQWRLCYATSQDGIHWVRPSLGVIEYRGSRDNNIVFERLTGGYHAGSVFKDPSAPSWKRYKYIYGGGEPLKIYGAYSPDGIRWTPCAKEPIIPWYTDTQNVCFWDDGLRKYVAFVRWNEKGYRAIGRTESEDFENFPPPVKVHEPEEEERRGDSVPAMDLYNSAAVKYPYAANSYFMFPSAYYHDPPHTMDVQLATSRDSIHFTRWKETFVRMGLEGAFDSQRIYMAPGMLRVGDEIWMYYGGLSRPHPPHPQARPYPSRHGSVGRVRIRLDGFVSQDAPRAVGHLTTVPLRFTGNRLEVNMDGSAGGWLKVEVLDESMNPIQGFSEGEGDFLWGNSVRKPVTWKGKGDLSTLAGRIVRLHFIGRSVKLYAFQFLE